MRIALEFEKKGPAKYISHLDLQRAFSRAIRRSGLPVKLSSGFNPHYTVSFASALALGIESECEIAEIVTERDVTSEDFLKAMKKALPPGLDAKSAVILRDDAPKMAAAVREAEYIVRIKTGNIEEIKNAVCDIIKSEELKISRDGKETDVRGMLISLGFCEGSIKMRLAASPSGTLRPDVLAGEIKKRAQFTCDISRTGLYTVSGGKTESLLSEFKK